MAKATQMVVCFVGTADFYKNLDIACASVVMPKSVYELLGCWQGRFHFHGAAKVCELCPMNL